MIGKFFVNTSMTRALLRQTLAVTPQRAVIKPRRVQF
jgi:hypothetical protein